MKTYKQVLINIDELKGYENNSRVHSDTQINQIANSIKEYGFTNPLLITENKTIIAGHGRLEAVKQLNKIDYKDTPINKIPCIVLSGLSQNDYKALVIADNKIALNAGWDLDILKDELESPENENYDMGLLGFSDSEISEILDSNIDYDSLGDSFTIPSNDKSDFKQITITLKTEHAEAILHFQKENQKTNLANGDNYNANANIIWNLLKDRV